MAAEVGVIPGIPGWQGDSQLHPYFVCDVFTSMPLQGNQLGVFVDGRPFSSEQMQSLTRELNVPETVFLLPPKQGGDVWVRIFTPGTELPFAGHPILGTSFVVGQALGADAVTLETGAGLVPVKLERDGDRIVFGWMQQPIPSWEPYEHERELLDALGVRASRLPIEAYRNGPRHVYVALPNEEAVAAVRPNMAALQDLNIGANCFAGRGRSWKTRMFHPGLGVPEDPATGSAAGPLAMHLARHGEIALGEEIEISQGVEIGRPSVLHAVASGTAERVTSVQVGGSAVIVAQGMFRISAP
jgi:trans-2,3-dihydro-3-hydroxyanthranilate isomerase